MSDDRAHITGPGARWIESAHKTKLSPFGAEVADLLWRLFSGIYHIDGPELRRTDWTNNSFVEITLPWHVSHSIATYDFDLMTKLVVLSHDECIRISISAHTFRTLKIYFHRRERADTYLDISRRMPTLEDHVAVIRKASGRVG